MIQTISTHREEKKPSLVANTAIGIMTGGLIGYSTFSSSNIVDNKGLATDSFKSQYIKNTNHQFGIYEQAKDLLGESEKYSEEGAPKQSKEFQKGINEILGEGASEKNIKAVKEELTSKVKSFEEGAQGAAETFFKGTKETLNKQGKKIFELVNSIIEKLRLGKAGKIAAVGGAIGFFATLAARSVFNREKIVYTQIREQYNAEKSEKAEKSDEVE